MLSQLGQLTHQRVNLLLLANYHPVELVEQVFGKTGLDLQRCQSLACDVLWRHSAIGP